MRRVLCAVTALCSMGVMAQKASATTTIYTSSSAFFNAETSTAANTNINFNSVEPYSSSYITEGSSFSYDNLNFNIGTGSGNVYVVGPTYGGPAEAGQIYGSSYVDIGSLNPTINLPSNITAIGFNYTSFYTNAASYTFTVNGASYQYNLASGGLGYFGVTSSTAISSISISTNNSNGTSIDNITYGASGGSTAVSSGGSNDVGNSVPEPAMAGILGLAFLGLAGFMRFNKQKALAA